MASEESDSQRFARAFDRIKALIGKDRIIGHSISRAGELSFIIPKTEGTEELRELYGELTFVLLRELLAIDPKACYEFVVPALVSRPPDSQYFDRLLATAVDAAHRANRIEDAKFHSMAVIWHALLPDSCLRTRRFGRFIAWPIESWIAMASAPNGEIAMQGLGLILQDPPGYLSVSAICKIRSIISGSA
jgi:hypothetical protein